MANYLDLNGTTDVVGRLKAKIAEKASNDDVQIIVDEVTLKADISKIGKINGQEIYDNGDITVSGGDGHFKYNTDSVDDDNGIVVFPNSYDIYTYFTLTSSETELPYKTPLNFKNVADGTYYITQNGYMGQATVVKSGDTLTFTAETMYNYLPLYKSDLSEYISDYSKSYTVDEVVIYNDVDSTYALSATPDMKLTRVLKTYDAGAYYVKDNNFSLLSTTDYVDEKIGDINNVLTSIIG